MGFMSTQSFPMQLYNIVYLLLVVGTFPTIMIQTAVGDNKHITMYQLTLELFVGFSGDFVVNGKLVDMFLFRTVVVVIWFVHRHLTV